MATKQKRGSRAQEFTPAIIQFFRECFTYSKSSGILRWRKDRPMHHFSTPAAYARYMTLNAGNPAGTAQGWGGGHLQVHFSQHPTEDRRYFNAYVHRIAYALVTGECPGDKFIDHRNGIVADNRWSNLRACEPWQNSANRKTNRASTTGIAGVNRSIRNGRTIYRATLQVRGTRLDRSFKTADAATAQRLEWEREYQGRFSPTASRRHVNKAQNA
ncbi:HNH endonuclease signature motif containing protein [Burkholderia cenocepacia]|uniref:HNH endonuclease signature motif containing protein n=1 Tax=Burkholderia cenocepacia TaxID=95486 RepID=UPI00097C897A|nr:HNH endonuclease signature motif containing protein [Burkholderia cenocepacia]AQQ46738.1 hypothetical protein A8F32_13100 [Burkholderia cenocepacia]ONI97074.1 hypothetical protein A8F33_33215 [Burkholderia cenocepacia]ONJ01598.1 hypothetical protein A8F53_16440 [Burkholderia cenocepacia]ONJ33923.1 hypothetical protein A8F38_07375 [Burkholderia cenocepacia]ONY73396.1 hypothetical protein A8F35_16015 [Burkholderia cenocepacia]